MVERKKRKESEVNVEVMDFSTDFLVVKLECVIQRYVMINHENVHVEFLLCLARLSQLHLTLKQLEMK